MDIVRSRLIDGLNNLNIDVSENQIEKLMSFGDMLIEKNKVMNLTAITDPLDIVDKHFLDSALLSSAVDINSAGSVIDVGTGGGFPGIPLSILYPDIKFLMIDSLNKRIKFVNEVIDSLDLSNARAVHGRAEDLARDQIYREQFDICVSRAVANLSTLCEYCIPFVRVGGVFVSYKSEGEMEEIYSAKDAIKTLSSSLLEVQTAIIPGTDIKRNFAVIEKKKSTADTYPRRAGIPSKKPLGL